MASSNRAHPGVTPFHVLLIVLIAVALAACGAASTPNPSSTPTGAPAEPSDVIAADIEGHVDDDDGTDEPVEGPVDPDNGFEPALYVDGDDRGRILGEDPEAVCDRSDLLRTETCTWTTGDGSESLSVEFSRDPNFATLEAYVEHMDVVMGSSMPIDDLGEAAYLGSNPLGSGVRLTAYVGDGLHIWVSIAMDGDDDALGQLAVELARKIVAMA